MRTNKWYSSSTYRVKSPEGTMFVTVTESDSGDPIAVDIAIGKAGSLIQAWARGMSRVLTTALESGTPIERIVEDLSAHTSDQARHTEDGVVIRSGVEGVCYALLEYRRAKYVPFDDEDEDDDDTERRGRFIRMAR